MTMTNNNTSPSMIIIFFSPASDVTLTVTVISRPRGHYSKQSPLTIDKIDHIVVVVEISAARAHENPMLHYDYAGGKNGTGWQKKTLLGTRCLPWVPVNPREKRLHAGSG